MTERWWDDEEEKTTKQTVEDLMNEAEIKRIQREEELKEAEHRAKMAKIIWKKEGCQRRATRGTMWACMDAVCRMPARTWA